MKYFGIPALVISLALFTINSAGAAVIDVDFTELSETAVITTIPCDFCGFFAYSAIATDVLPTGDVFEATAGNPFEGVRAPSFTPAEIDVSERGGFIGFNPPSASPFMAIVFSATATTGPDGAFFLAGVEDDYLIRVTTDAQGEIYFGLAEDFNANTVVWPATTEMPRQTIFRTGPTQLGSFGRVSGITAYGVQLIPEPSPALLLMAAACPALLRRRRR